MEPPAMLKFVKALDLYSTIKLLLYASKALGVAPFVLEGEIGSRKLRISRPAVIYSVIILLMLLGRQIFLIREILFSQFEAVFKTTAVIETLTYSISTSGFALMFLFQSNNICRILHKLSLFDELVPGMEKSYKPALLLLIAQMCLHSAIFFTLGLFVSAYTGFLNFLYFVINSAAANDFPIILIVDTQLFNIMLLLKQRFSTINLKITECLNENQIKFSVQLPNNVTVPLITHIPKVSVTEMSLEISRKRMKRLRNVHEFLCDISELVNRTYAIHMLLNVMLKFIVIVFNVYFRLLRVLKSDKGQYDDDVWEWVMTGMLIWNVSKLSAILWACSSTTQEVSCLFPLLLTN
jgi:hypothetical protein